MEYVKKYTNLNNKNCCLSNTQIWFYFARSAKLFKSAGWTALYGWRLICFGNFL